MKRWTKWTGLLTLGAAGLLCAGTARADFVNGSFETGDLNGWTATVPAGASATVVDRHVAQLPSVPVGFTFLPTDGSFFALIKTDGPGNFTRLTQTVTVGEGTSIEFDIFFDSGDAGPFPAFNDIGQAVLTGPGGTSTTLFTATAQSVGTAGHTPWTTVRSGSLSAGTYTLAVEVANVGSAGFDSFVGLDRVAVIPEPSSLTLLGLGVAGLLGCRLRRRGPRA